MDEVPYPTIRLAPMDPCLRPMVGDSMTEPVCRNCTRCGQLLPVDDFYFISKKTGKRRGQCKGCMREIKAAQRDPAWQPECSRCGKTRPRVGPGRRLCAECFNAIYDAEAKRANGSHRTRLNPCTACGAVRLREDHMHGSSLCPICRSIPQGRRTKLKTRFALTPREFVELVANQGDVCAVCRKRPAQSLHIDHRHADPPIIRGALCNVCNTMIGLANDDPERLRQAAAYLEDPPAQRLFPGRVATPQAKRPVWFKLTRVKVQ